MGKGGRGNQSLQKALGVKGRRKGCHLSTHHHSTISKTVPIHLILEEFRNLQVLYRDTSNRHTQKTSALSYMISALLCVTLDGQIHTRAMGFFARCYQGVGKGEWKGRGSYTTQTKIKSQLNVPRSGTEYSLQGMLASKRAANLNPKLLFWLRNTLIVFNSLPHFFSIGWYVPNPNTRQARWVVF